jgi:hypothetical protein
MLSSQRPIFTPAQIEQTLAAAKERRRALARGRSASKSLPSGGRQANRQIEAGTKPARLRATL